MIKQSLKEKKKHPPYKMKNEEIRNLNVKIGESLYEKIKAFTIRNDINIAPFIRAMVVAIIEQDEKERREKKAKDEINPLQ
jgi:hypothetical protein